VILPSSLPARPRTLHQRGAAALRPLLATLLLLGGAAVPLLEAPVARASSLFQVGEVEQERFVLVSAPIGDGTRAQLNIYEQVKATRPCFAVGSGKPAPVNPLLGSFDFTGICSRFIDANGYSVRVGGSDLGTVYRLSVIQGNDDILLMAMPTKAGVGPEMVVARTQGAGSGFLKLELEPGWRLMRRHFGNRVLGHVYLYRDSWPSENQAAVTPAEPG
jgi:hypothetical protein